MPTDWTIDSWQRKPASQQVEYDDEVELTQTLDRLRALPPIVTSWEVEKLKRELADEKKKTKKGAGKASDAEAGKTRPQGGPG